MPIVQFKDKKKFVKALEVFLRTGGTIEGREDNVLIVSWRHYAAFVNAGLIKPPEQYNMEKRRAPKKTKARSRRNSQSAAKRASSPKSG